MDVFRVNKGIAMFGRSRRGMTQYSALAGAIALLLATPGPTNTLLAASGAAHGWRRSLPMVAAELGGYLSAILPLLFLVAPVVDQAPAALTALKGAAFLWLAYCALKLWRGAGNDPALGAAISIRRVYLTTLLNPKALLFSFIILPRAPLAEAVTGLALFAALVVAIGSGWSLAGTLLTGGRRPLLSRHMVARLAAIVLAIFAGLIAGSAIAALVG
jgi:threonine/homoserine/homoserine lactone efflux protein